MKKSKKKKMIIIFILAVVLAGGVAAVSYLKSTVAGMREKIVPVQVYAKHDLSTSIGVKGTVESQNVLIVATDLTCKIKELNVSLGDYVNEGDVLCVFDDTGLREQISQLEEQVSETEKRKAKQDEINQRTLSQARENRTKGIDDANEKINRLQDQYDQAVSRYNQAKGTEYEAEAEAKMKELSDLLKEAKDSFDEVQNRLDEVVQQAQDTVDLGGISDDVTGNLTKELSELYRQLNEVTVKAGQSGIITRLNVSQGSIPNGPLMQIEDDKNLKVKVSIKEKDIVKLSNGMEAEITSDSLPDKTYAGQIRKIINFSASGSGSIGDSDPAAASGYSAEISINEQTELLLGMSAKVEIAVERIEPVMSVAYDSILEENDAKYVYKAEKSDNGKYQIKRIKVETGKEGEYYVQISSPELKEGDLIVMIPNLVTEGEQMMVNIHEGKEN